MNGEKKFNEPIVVEAPDGEVIEFPGTMTDDQISAAMRKLYPTGGFLERLSQKTAQIEQGFGQGLQGAGKALKQTGINIGSMLPPTTALGALAKNAPPITPPQPGPEATGYALTKAATMFAPMAIPRAASLPLRIAQEMSETAAMTAADTGKMQEAATWGGIAGALTATSGVLGKVIRQTGEKIMTSTIKGTAADAKHGYKAENIFKYDVGGNLDTALKKTLTRIKAISQQRNAMIDPAIQVDMNKVFAKVASDLRGEVAAGKLMGGDKAALSELQRFMESMQQVSPNGMVNLQQAENMKEAIGDYGAWIYGHVDYDAKAKEHVANELYMAFKKEIENLTPPGKIKELNRQLADLIPIKNAIIRRIPVAERNNLLSLGDITSLLPAMMTGNTGALAFYLVQKGSKLGSVGNFLAKHGQRPTQMLGTLAGKGAAAIGIQNPFAQTVEE